jgi:hypothetical protein
MHATTPVPVVQQTAEASPSPCNARATTEVKPVNHNGPQCASCGWRGGEHACVLSPSLQDAALTRLFFLQFKLPLEYALHLHFPFDPSDLSFFRRQILQVDLY